MSTYRLPPRTASYENTVKCSTCAIDVPLVALADHVCSYQPYDQQPTEHYQTNEPQPVHPPRRGASLFRRAQPTFPPIDSSLSNRGGLNSRDAAEVAYDLGLPSPSPPSVGSGRHSPRPPSTRKTSKRQILTPVPAELPLAQDCAFPPFPSMKPKRANTAQDITIKPRSSSRSTHRAPSRSNTFDSSRSQSISDRVQSPTGTDIITRTTSNSSSEVRSRKNTMDGSRSVLSPMPGSPEQYSHDGLSQEHLEEPMPTLPVIDESYQTNSQDLIVPASSMENMMPPPMQISPRKKSQSPFANHYQPELNPIIDEPVEISILDPILEMETDIPAHLTFEPAMEPAMEHTIVPVIDSIPDPIPVPVAGTMSESSADPFVTSTQEGTDPSVTFDSLLPAERTNHGETSPDPTAESLYQARRPPPLIPQTSNQETSYTVPLSARDPTTPLAAGFGRAITNLFGRKRSRSMTGKGKPTIDLDSIDLDSPRMRALAPEPPPVPAQYESEDYFQGLAESSPHLQSESMIETEELKTPPLISSISPPTESKSETDTQVNTKADEAQEHELEEIKTTEIMQFDFKFNNVNAETSQAEDDLTQATPGETLGAAEDEVIADEAAEPVTDLSTESASTPAFPAAEPSMSLQEESYHEAISSTITVADALHRMSIDSASSYGSVDFTSRTTSSQSSLPPVEEIVNIDAVVAESKHISTTTLAFPVPLSRMTTTESVEYPTETARQSLSSSSKPQPSPSPVKERSLSSKVDALPEEHQPAISISMPEPVLSASTVNISRSPEVLSPQKVMAPPGSKGICRGCSQIILAGQKSVSSRDGRLSGRYHKECFTCRTCCSPFATADFYVHDDQPYCAHDYHVINNTLCEACGKGIEGQYLESLDAAGQKSKKYHPGCLRCATCRCQLDADYFELHGRVYCERDAFRSAHGPKTSYSNMPSRPSPLVREYVNSGDLIPKGRFPERRTTRLMMT